MTPVRAKFSPAASLVIYIAACVMYIAACARPLATRQPNPIAGAQHAPHQLRDVVEGAELARVSDLTVYDAISRLRPEYLHGRGGYYPKVYFDGLLYGEMVSLRQLRADGIAVIRHLDAVTATTRFGTGHTGGAILLSTGREPLTR